jgi:hypothetical protein
MEVVSGSLFVDFHFGTFELEFFGFGLEKGSEKEQERQQEKSVHDRKGSGDLHPGQSKT